MCAVVRQRALMAWQAARLITNPSINAHAPRSKTKHLEGNAIKYKLMYVKFIVLKKIKI
jgi:hypothetical protein